MNLGARHEICIVLEIARHDFELMQLVWLSSYKDFAIPRGFTHMFGFVCSYLPLHIYVARVCVIG